jgi:hypothetical protein
LIDAGVKKFKGQGSRAAEKKNPFSPGKETRQRKKGLN